MNIAAYLDLLGKPYTGAGPHALYLAQDKALAKKIFAFHGIRTPYFATSYRGQARPLPRHRVPADRQADVRGRLDRDRRELGRRISVKELMEKIHYIQEEFDSPALIEEYIEGREIYAAVLGNENPEVLPLVELDLSRLPEGTPRIAGTEVKWEKETEHYRVTKSAPAEDLDEDTVKRLSDTALAAYQALKLRDYGRIDMRLTPKGRGLRHRGQPQSLARLGRRVRHGRQEGRPQVVHAADRRDRGSGPDAVHAGIGFGLTNKERDMKKAMVLAAALVLAFGSAAFAAEVGGVTVPDTATVDGKALKLNGAGLRKKMMFKVYVAGLYVETPSKDAAALISSNQIKSMRLHMLRNVEGAKVSGAVADGFALNSKAALPKLQSRLDQFAKMIPDMKEGEEIDMTWVPDKGTEIAVRGTNAGTIEGRDFADALFSVWLGPSPVQDGLKAALTGLARGAGLPPLFSAGLAVFPVSRRTVRSIPTPTNISLVQNHIAGETRSTPPASVVVTAARIVSGGCLRAERLEEDRVVEGVDEAPEARPHPPRLAAVRGEVPGVDASAARERAVDRLRGALAGRQREEDARREDGVEERRRVADEDPAVAGELVGGRRVVGHAVDLRDTRRDPASSPTIRGDRVIICSKRASTEAPSPNRITAGSKTPPTLQVPSENGMIQYQTPSSIGSRMSPGRLSSGHTSPS